MQILVTAEMFGYGPIITCNYLVESLKNKVCAKWIFMGSGIAMEQAKRTGFFDEYVFCETYDIDELEKKRNYFEESDAVISVENLQGALFCVRNSFKVYYIDNLFWLWGSIPEELNKVSCYFIVDYFNARENINRIGQGIKKYEFVGPLRKFNVIESDRKENKILINFGGAESFLSNFELVLDFYSIALKGIFSTCREAFIEEIVVCGGNRMVESIKDRLGNESDIRYASFSKEDYLEELRTAQYVILSPGIGNFSESLDLSIPIMMLPPINYSQFWQMEEYKKLGLGIEMKNWNDFQWYVEVERNVEESIGVDQVMENVQRFVKDEAAWHELYHEAKRYVNMNGQDYSKCRKDYQRMFCDDGIEHIARVISKEM